MTLQSMEPTPTWNEDAHEDVVSAFAALAADESVEISLWCADWCGDCRSELPDFGAALEAAAFPDDRLNVYPVERGDNGAKEGEKVDEYDVTLIPTIVVERDDVELARFEENATLPAAAALAEELRDADVNS